MQVQSAFALALVTMMVMALVPVAAESSVSHPKTDQMETIHDKLFSNDDDIRFKFENETWCEDCHVITSETTTELPLNGTLKASSCNYCDSESCVTIRTQLDYLTGQGDTVKVYAVNQIISFNNCCFWLLDRPAEWKCLLKMMPGAFIGGYNTGLWWFHSGAFNEDYVGHHCGYPDVPLACLHP